MKPHTQQFLQKRRFYMALPVLVLPFVTMIFWALGGGKGNAAPAQEIHSGLNMELPGAHFDKDEELWDKFSLYEQAKRDSLKYEEARRNDPYYVVSTLRVSSQDTSKHGTGSLNTSLGTKDRFADMERDQALIDQRLKDLTTTINQPQAGVPVTTKSEPSQSKEIMNDSGLTTDVDRLEKMMEVMSNGSANDPEMQQIGDVLDKILDIQHPERINEKIREQSSVNKERVFAVLPVSEETSMSTITAPSENPGDTGYRIAANMEPVVASGFFGLDEDISQAEEIPTAIQAVVHETQTVVVGSTIRLRLLSDVYISGRLIKAGQFVYGKCSISGDRLSVSVNSIRDENSLLPVALSVYDLDGMEGISIPGAITRDAAKQAGSQSIQDGELYSMDNSLGVQAATAGIEAAKGLFTKKIKLVKVTVKAGYQVLLQDNNQQNQ